MTISPYLTRPLRSEAEARADRDDAMLAGLFTAIDALRVVAEAQQARAETDRGRLACAVVARACRQMRVDADIPF